MTTVDAQGFIWVKDATKAESEKLVEVLSFVVPGREHMPLYKKGRWDGVKRFYDWRLKRFRRGLAGLVRRQTGLTIDTTPQEPLPMPVLLSPEGKDFLDQKRQFQPRALAALLGHGRDEMGGVAKMATNAGKTAVIAGVVKALNTAGLSVVIFERMEDLLGQVKAEVEAWSGLRLGEWSRRVKDIRPVTVVMAQSAYSALDKVVKFGEEDPGIVAHLRAVSAVCIDEVHHATAESYVRLLDLNPGSLRFGFSGTVPAEDHINGVEIRGLFGDVVAEVSNTELIDAGISARPIVRVVEYEVEGLEDKAKALGKEIRADCMKVVGKDASGRVLREFSTSAWTSKVRDYVMSYAMRQDLGFWNMVKELLERHPNDSAAVLVDWVEFAEDLARHIGAEVLHGTVARGDRERILAGFSSGEIKRVVATSVLDEGMSIDRIKVLVLANSGMSTRQFLQRVGRGLRKKLDDNTLTVYCFAMYGHKYLLGPSKERLKIWKNEGFEVVFDGEGKQ